MARRKSSKKPRRKTQKKLNLLGVAESVVIANVVTEGLFNCNAIQFVTGRGVVAGYDGYMPRNTDDIITLPELLGMDYNKNQNMSGGTPLMMPFSSVGAAAKIKANAKQNAFTMLGGLIAVPIAFRVATKLTTKPRATFNKMLDYTKVGVKV
jgi:hypothetical protein|tara:strand:+ start:90 stop:545 length:456 start_codon:yes stop_codon:yes gene_type:complete